jgi:hypothetical protein
MKVQNAWMKVNTINVFKCLEKTAWFTVQMYYLLSGKEIEKKSTHHASVKAKTPSGKVSSGSVSQFFV